ncbi:MAG: ABC transporter permease, partial [Caldilineaceae bacterium]|nr:ABC transporter permease [Caldilineaceae bacterium]
FKYFNQSVGGLFSPEYQEAPWNMAKVGDLLAHLWIPIIIIGTDGTAGLIRIMRANLLDELRKPYVVTARAKGLPEWKLLLKYPVRVALNPFISTVGWVLPGLVSGSAIVSIVLSLPTTGPLLLRALLSQDMYLAGSFLLMLSILTVIGTLLSDILLAWLDPRIRYE